MTESQGALDDKQKHGVIMLVYDEPSVANYPGEMLQSHGDDMDSTFAKTINKHCMVRFLLFLLVKNILTIYKP